MDSAVVVALQPSRLQLISRLDRPAAVPGHYLVLVVPIMLPAGRPGHEASPDDLCRLQKILSQLTGKVCVSCPQDAFHQFEVVEFAVVQMERLSPHVQIQEKPAVTVLDWHVQVVQAS